MLNRGRDRLGRPARKRSCEEAMSGRLNGQETPALEAEENTDLAGCWDPLRMLEDIEDKISVLFTAISSVPGTVWLA